MTSTHWLARTFTLTFAALLLSGGPSTGRAGAEGQPAPSSYELIQRRETSGVIDVETAHRYRVFAAFRDSRLPAAFRGNDSDFPEPPESVLQVAELLPTLSAQTRAELEPFFIPPGEPGSWVNLRTVFGRAGGGDDADGEPSPREVTRDGGPSESPVLAACTAGLRGCPGAAESPQQPAINWYTVRAAGGRVKIWADPANAGDNAKADAIALAMTSTIWPRLTQLFWEPMSDATAARNNGGPELDFFLLRPDFGPAGATVNQAAYGTTSAWAGIALTSNPGSVCATGPRYLMIDSRRPLGNATTPGLLHTVVHEFTHAITQSIAMKAHCNTYTWMREATATWAEHYVYPRAQAEWHFASSFFQDPARSLDRIDPGPIAFHAYGGYVFPFYLMTSGKLQAIPAIWRQFATHEMRAGIDAGLKGVNSSFAKEFPRFAVRNLNTRNVDDYFRADDMRHRFNILDTESIFIPAGAPFHQKDITMGMRYLATKYSHVAFEPAVRTVTFDHPLGNIAWASVWAIEKIRGTWKPPRDLTANPSTTWCRSTPTENIEELVLVFTNTEWEDTLRTVDPGVEVPVVRSYRTGCGGWTGTTTMTTTLTSTDPAITIEQDVSAQMQFAVDSSQIVPGSPIEYWKVVSGMINWRVTVRGSCTGQSSGAVAIRDMGPGDEVATLRIWADSGTLHHSGTNGPWPGDVPQFQMTCPEGQMPMTLTGALGWFVTDVAKDGVAPDGKSFSGRHTSSPAPGIVTTHRYDFKCTSGC